MKEKYSIKGMKNISKRVVFIGLFLILAFTLCAYEYLAPSPPAAKYEPVIFLDEAKDLSDEEIARKLFAIYLEHYKSQDIPENRRLKDYKVVHTTKIKVAEGIFFDVGYSLQPYPSSYNYGRPGNGRDENDNWIVHKINYIRLITDEGQYRMELHGTGL